MSASPCTRSTSKEGDPVTWFTFYSHREKREYYYEPISGTTTWIAPSRTHGVISHLPGSPDEESNTDLLSLYQRKVLPFITRPTVAVSMFLFNVMLLFVWLKTGCSDVSSQTLDASTWTPPLTVAVELKNEQYLPIDLSIDILAIGNDQEVEESLKLQPARSPAVPQPAEPMTTVDDTDEAPLDESTHNDAIMLSKDPTLLHLTSNTSIDDDDAHPVAINDLESEDTLQVAAEEMHHRAFDEADTVAVDKVDSFKEHHDTSMRDAEKSVDATEPIASEVDNSSIPGGEEEGNSRHSEVGEDGNQGNSKPNEFYSFEVNEETSEEPATVPNDDLMPRKHGLHEDVTMSESHDAGSETEITAALGIGLTWPESDVLLEKVLTNAITAGFTIDREPVGHHEVVLRPLEEIVSSVEGDNERNSLCGNRMAKILLPHCRDERVSST